MEIQIISKYTFTMKLCDIDNFINHLKRGQTMSRKLLSSTIMQQHTIGNNNNSNNSNNNINSSAVHGNNSNHTTNTNTNTNTNNNKKDNNNDNNVNDHGTNNCSLIISNIDVSSNHIKTHDTSHISDINMIEFSSELTPALTPGNGINITPHGVTPAITPAITPHGE